MDESYVLLSGGPDSTTLAYWLHEERETELRGIYAHHGQPSGDAELASAKAAADSLGISLRVLDMRPLWDSISDATDPHPTMMGGCTDPMWLIQLAANYAAWAGGDRLALGIHADDIDNLPWVPELLDHYQAALDLIEPAESGHPVGGEEFEGFSIEYPLADRTKVELLELGEELGAPLQKTWSCLKEGPVHCGECGGCRSRREAFEEAGIENWKGKRPNAGPGSDEGDGLTVELESRYQQEVRVEPRVPAFDGIFDLHHNQLIASHDPHEDIEEHLHAHLPHMHIRYGLEIPHQPFLGVDEVALEVAMLVKTTHRVDCNPIFVSRGEESTGIPLQVAGQDVHWVHNDEVSEKATERYQATGREISDGYYFAGFRTSDVEEREVWQYSREELRQAIGSGLRADQHFQATWREAKDEAIEPYPVTIFLSDDTTQFHTFFELQPTAPLGGGCFS